jgi:homocitrate synthase NifV
MLIDTTLREGEQRYQVYFSPEDKRSIVEMLARTGVDEVELGVAGRDVGLSRLVHEARAILPLRTRVSVWSAARRGDLVRAAAMQPDIINMAIPVSDLHIEKRLGRDRAFVLDRIRQLLEFAGKICDARISIGLEDATRADLDFLLEAARTAEEAGAWRVRISDTIGMCDPLRMARIVNHVRETVSCRLAVHCHDDLGMATANAVASLSAGADSADVSALGLGERAGIAALEQVAAHAVLNLGSEAYDLLSIKELCGIVGSLASVPATGHEPVIGERLFWCETGLHVDALYKDQRTYEPFDPKLVAATRKRSLGKKSGAAAVRWKCAELSVDMNCESLVEAVRRRSEQNGGVLDDTDLIALTG